MRGIRSTRLITPEGIRPGCVYWEGEKICAVTENPLEGVPLLDVGSAWVTAGFIDLHTHGGELVPESKPCCKHTILRV